jgi:anaerobic selenocysteine-containing dehydrogenase/Fe-S-cluster-containing dehydrogenase component
MPDLKRRDFLKILGVAGTGTLWGCSDNSPTRLIPYIFPPEDIIPGKAEWYASTCRECPAGCGLLAKNRDGRVIKVEGNPTHPISHGNLCPRGQASLQGLYNPDRYSGPLVRKDQGKFSSISWDEGEEMLFRTLDKLVRQGRGDRIVFLSELNNGRLMDLADYWLAEMGSRDLLLYEPYAYEPLRRANEKVFQFDGLPHYRIDQADFLISFGAGFLETWISNLEFARQFSIFHQLQPQGKNPFVYVGPRLSLTANNADQWIFVPPGDEYLIALGILQGVLDEGPVEGFPSQQRAALRQILQDFPLEGISRKTRAPIAIIRDLARRFNQAQRPLALAEGLGLSGPQALETAVVANLLCLLKPGTRETIDFTSPLALGRATPLSGLKTLTEQMKQKEIDLLLMGQVNPVFNLPFSEDFREGLSTVPLVVSFSSYRDETSQQAHLILPNHTFLESWGDYSPRTGVLDLMQPVMGPVFQTKPVGDVLINLGRKIRGPDKFPWGNFYQFLRQTWSEKGKKREPEKSPEAFWQKAVANGGVWEEAQPVKARFPSKALSLSFPPIGAITESDQKLGLTLYPTIQFFDGRQANRPWLQELPDPITQITWDGWLEINPETAKVMGLQKGDLLLLRSPYGSLEVPAYPVPTVPPGVVALPIGQGHWNYGRFADGRPANPLALFSRKIDPNCDGFFRPDLRVNLQKLGRKLPMAHVDGSYTQEDREMVQVMAWKDYRQVLESGRSPDIDWPLPQGVDPRKDFYPTHEHKDYRWCMVVDLNRCIGCSACVVACYAENNVAVVEKEQVLKGREMAWIRIQRYFDPKEMKAYWLPMLCQHCDFAPCESVCPVYAPFHNPEGLNTQVYNRCMGTRFCLQNDPYKVRRFNFFNYPRPKPLDWQLNPDVTVRTKGVMEKCSFCIQRIVEVKIKAKEEGRKVRDGEFTTACAQTCPTEALIFGNLLDPGSRVSKLIKDVRRYQVLGHLNTKPAVIYLKKVEM